ncbi:MAG: OmpA family protein [Polyangiaceae bacterium]
MRAAKFRLLAALGPAWLALVAGRAQAAGLAIHAEGGAARMVGEDKSDQFGWGGSGLVAPELRLGRVIGIELPMGGVGLSDSDTPPEAGFADSGSGTALFATPGLRLHPLATLGDNQGMMEPDGLWIAGGGGVAHTGDLTRPAASVRVGYDLATRAFAAGPFLGLLQIVEPDGGLRPSDGRVALAGLHATFDPGIRKGQPQSNDRDRDGILDATDACPDDPEDKDGFQDQDGCPEADNDKDGILDPRDKCPLEPEDKDGFQDQDGCPDLDNDADGLADLRDKCPNDPEDKDGFQDEDGCPEADNDGDGLADVNDKCPDEPETKNGYADEDGCPDTEQVRVVGNQIELDDRIYFRTNGAEIEVRSFKLMIKIAQLLKEHPEYERVHIKGHADDTGTEEYNLRLSESRARSVRKMLVDNGVTGNRLTVEAFGESKPREEGTTEQARQENRRVEFEIVERRQSQETVQ